MLVRSLLLILALVVTLPRSVSAADDPYTGAFWLPLSAPIPSLTASTAASASSIRAGSSICTTSTSTCSGNRSGAYLMGCASASCVLCLLRRSCKARETNHHPAAGLAITAFIEKFPCPDDDAKGPPRSMDD